MGIYKGLNPSVSKVASGQPISLLNILGLFGAFVVGCLFTVLIGYTVFRSLGIDQTFYGSFGPIVVFIGCLAVLYILKRTKLKRAHKVMRFVTTGVGIVNYCWFIMLLPLIMELLTSLARPVIQYYWPP